MPIVLRFDPLYEDVRPPARATAGSAGYDLCAHLTGSPIRVRRGMVIAEERAHDGVLTLMPGDVAIVPLGFRLQLPPGYEAQIRPRSGVSFKTELELANAPGTIDSDYAEEWGVIVRHRGQAGPLTVCHGDRIAQMVVARVEVAEFERGAVGRSTERAGGFGSTG